MKFEKYIMHYEIKENSNNIRILGEEFVRKNKNRGKIIFKDKKFPLIGLFQIKDIKTATFKIKLLLDKNCTHRSCMFKDCSSLFIIKSNNDFNIEDIFSNIISN